MSSSLRVSSSVFRKFDSVKQKSEKPVFGKPKQEKGKPDMNALKQEIEMVCCNVSNFFTQCFARMSISSPRPLWLRSWRPTTNSVNITLLSRVLIACVRLDER